MTRVLLVATTTGYQIRSFEDAARRLGAVIQIASDRCDRLDDPWRDEAVPVRFFDEPASVASVLTACADRRPDAVLAVGDRPAVLAAHLSAAFDLPGNPPDAVARSRNKLQAHEALRRSGLRTADFRAISLRDDPAALAAATAYPAVLKPLALSGSRGVMRVNDAREFTAAFARLQALMVSPDVLAERDAAHTAALVESFIPGAEFALEGVLTCGTLRPLAIVDKPDPLDGPFFEETIYVTPSRHSADVQQRVVDAVQQAAAALGLRHGPVHAECRVNDSGVYALEVAPRPIGGLCSKALRFVSPDDLRGGISLEEVLLRHALGEDINPFEREAAASGVMMIPIPRRGILREVRGIERARAAAGIDDVTITAKPDALLVPLPEGRSYLGFIFSRGDDPAAAERSLRDAHARLEFVIDRDVPLTRSG